jgi:hypothetical protein
VDRDRIAEVFPEGPGVVIHVRMVLKGIDRTDLDPETCPAFVASLLIDLALQILENNRAGRTVGLTSAAAHTNLFFDDHTF